MDTPLRHSLETWYSQEEESIKRKQIAERYLFLGKRVGKSTQMGWPVDKILEPVLRVPKPGS